MPRQVRRVVSDTSMIPLPADETVLIHCSGLLTLCGLKYLRSCQQVSCWHIFTTFQGKMHIVVDTPRQLSVIYGRCHQCRVWWRAGGSMSPMGPGQSCDVTPVNSSCAFVCFIERSLLCKRPSRNRVESMFVPEVVYEHVPSCITSEISPIITQWPLFSRSDILNCVCCWSCTI